jgi:hypothetical protein
MSRPISVDRERFARINARLTRIALKRLNLACEMREHEEAMRVPQGTILTQMIMGTYPGCAGLPAHPDEEKATVRRRKQQQANTSQGAA